LKDKKYDVIVVGAGPAGAVTARGLAGAGVKTLLVEKEKLPRYKTCAGGINVRAANLLDFDITPVVERVINGARFSYKSRYRLTRRYPQPTTYMVTRQRFDNLLAEKAQEAGAELVDGRKVTRVEPDDGMVRVTAGGEVFNASVVVGADGANGLVAAGLGLKDGFYCNLGLEAEVYADEKTLARWENLMGLDLGTIPGGYGWIFPKGDHLSVGIGGPMRFAKKLDPWLRGLLRCYDLDESRIRILRGARLPVRRRGTPIAAGRGLLVGDAAGLTDAVTGEGIYYAIKSGQMAVPAVVGFLGGEPDGLAAYQRAVDTEMMPELDVTRALARIFTWLTTGTPPLFFKLTAEKERAWRAFCRIIRGEKSYVSLKDELGPFRFIFDLLAR
jgi:geranylgeranyl reductase family protein